MIWNDVQLGQETEKPLYLQIADYLRRQIAARQLEPGEKLPPARELCRIFGVSAITIEAGINALVQENYLGRRPRFGTFVKEPALATGAKPVGVVFSANCVGNSYWYRMLEPLEKALAGHGFRLLLIQLRPDKKWDPRIGLDGCSGALLCGHNSLKLANVVEAMGLPLVLIGSCDDAPEEFVRFDSVEHDEVYRAYFTIRHLIDLEHRRIAGVTGPTASTLESNHRQGIRKAMTESGLGDGLTLESVKLHTVEAGMEAAYRLLCVPNRPTAIFACDDRIAAGIIRTAFKLGIKVPEQLSVIGSGGLEICEVIVPALTTSVSCPDRTAQLAADKFHAQLTDPAHVKGRSVIKIEHLRFGESTRVCSAGEYNYYRSENNNNAFQSHNNSLPNQ